MKALFEVGEEVLELWSTGAKHICSILEVQWDEKVLITNVHSGVTSFYTGYSYRTTSSDRWALEHGLRKLPKPADCSFEEMMTKLKTGNRETVHE